MTKLDQIQSMNVMSERRELKRKRAGKRRLVQYTKNRPFSFSAMPRRISIIASGEKQSQSSWKESEVPSLWELCSIALYPTLHKQGQAVAKRLTLLPEDDRRTLASALLKRKRATRESLALLSVRLIVSSTIRRAPIPSCVILDLSGSQITDSGLHVVSGLTSLQYLSLRNCRNISNSGLLHLRGTLPSLTILQSYLMSKKALQELEHLDISKCKAITDEGIAQMTGTMLFSSLWRVLTFVMNRTLSVETV